MAESIRVLSPADRVSARLYILSVLLEDFLGLSVVICFEDRADVMLVLPSGGTVRVSDKLFSIGDDAWLKPKSLPERPLMRMQSNGVLAIEDFVDGELERDGIPVIFGQQLDDGSFVKRDDDRNLRLGLDVFGSAFFMLTRYEEAAAPVLDGHGRFPAAESLAYGEGFLDHPIVNIYADLLWAVVSELEPGLTRATRSFEILPTHDVDVPSEITRDLKGIILHAGRLTLLDRNPRVALIRFWNWCWITYGKGIVSDRFNTFDRLMTESEKRGLRSCFNFMAGNYHPVDCNLLPSNPLIRRIIREVGRRGHEVGFHPSYSTMDNPILLKEEFHRLLKVAEQEGIEQDTWGGRQHYLRWRTPQSFRYWNDAGLDYDSTLSYADASGFRCGSCYPYRTYDVGRDRELDLVEQPLLLMEASLISPNYMGFGDDFSGMSAYIEEIKARCRRHQGKFIFLWHNSNFTRPEYWDVYCAALD